MVSTVAKRPSHYEVLGLTPTATGDEIARAFAREMSAFRPHTVGGVADLSVAYETLRDPAKRKAYDASIGLGPKAEAPRPPTMAWGGGAFLVRASAHPAERNSADPLHRPAREAAAPPAAPVQRPQVSPIAAALEELAKPGVYAPEPPRQAERPRPVQPKPDDALESLVRDILADGRAERDRLRNERRPFDWRRPALAAGGLVIGAGLIGILAGVTVSNNEAPSEAQPSLSVRLPSAKHAAVAHPAPAPELAEVQAPPPARTFAAPARDKRAAPQRRPSRWADEVAQSLLPATAASESAAAAPVEEAAAEASTPAVTEAKLPLSNAVIARTIGRIGYACGEVASTSAIDGGAFKVTCTSGASYRAAPVRGRYHFRRLP